MKDGEGKAGEFVAPTKMGERWYVSINNKPVLALRSVRISTAEEYCEFFNAAFSSRVKPLVEALEEIRDHCDPAGLNGSAAIAKKALADFRG